MPRRLLKPTFTFLNLLINQITEMENRFFLLVIFALTLGCFVLNLPQVYRAYFSFERGGTPFSDSVAGQLKEIGTALEELSGRGKLMGLTPDQNGTGPAEEPRVVNNQENLTLELKIEILNASKVNGAATDLKQSLEQIAALSLSAISVGNADPRPTTLFEVKPGLDQRIRDLIYQEVEKDSSAIEIIELGRESPLDLVITIGSDRVD